jgi:uncharacterized protein YgiM (DUF1202 family)
MTRSKVFAVAVLVALACLITAAQNPKGERDYNFDESDVRKALADLKVEAPIKLPTLRGFIADNVALGEYERPYAQYEVELIPSEDHTLVRVKASITAWHTDPRTSAQEYRNLLSSGRLESDLLDRVAEQLKKSAADPTARVAALQQQLTDIRAKREQLEQRASELRAELKNAQSGQDAAAAQSDMAVVESGLAEVRTKPSPASRVLMRARTEDTFPVVQERNGWVSVRLASDEIGWVKRSQLKPAAANSDRAAEAAALDLEFAITKEEVMPFLGAWPALKGRKALFVYARPLGSSTDVALGRKKLAYAQQVFATRYAQAAHSDQSFAGVVVIFLGNGGGIAAATLDKIARWRSRAMSESSFLKYCSLDPPGVFGSAAERVQMLPQAR